MLVQQDAQEQLFYSFRLEEQVTSDHLLRQLDAVLSFRRLRHSLGTTVVQRGPPQPGGSLVLPSSA